MVHTKELIIQVRKQSQWLFESEIEWFLSYWVPDAH